MFVRLTSAYTEASILVNLGHIEILYPDPDGRCALVTSQGADAFIAKETFEQVSLLISTRIINP